MSALMPETNRKTCVDPTGFPMHRQNTSNQTPANASTSAAQLTASPGPYTACSWPQCQLRRSCQDHSEAICKTKPCKQHLGIHNPCIDDPEENVQCSAFCALTMLLLKSILQDP